MYTWSQLGINEITNPYLYGATTKPQDLTSEALIRAKGYTTPVQLDAVSFMENGPGRFANGVTISVVKEFMEGKVYAPNGSKQTFSIATVTALLEPLSANVGIAQSSYQDTTDDHASRTYIYQSSPYKLAQGATFVIEEDGTRHIQDFAILPLDEDFDFKSKALLSQFGNQYLEPRIDPTGIGRIVTLEFDQTSKTQVPRVDYTSANYASDSVRYQQTFSPITGTAQLAIEMPQVVADLWTQGVTQIVDQQERLVLHGTNGADSLSPATGTAGADTLTGTALSETIQALGADDVVTARAGDDVVLGGDGNDVLMGDSGNDTLYGDAGNDLLAGGAGNDALLGGDGDDIYLFQAGDGQDTATDVLGQNLIVLGAGLTLAAITFIKSDNDLLMAINGSTDRLTVKDWFATDSHFTSVTLGDGRVLDRTAVQTALPPNQAPLAVADSASVSEDMVLTATGNVLSNDSDPEGRALRVTNSGSYAGAVGTLTLNDTGAYSYALNNGAIAVQSLAAGQSLAEHFAYTVSDDAPTDPATSSSQISVVVTGRNDAPVVATALADQSITANAMWNWTLPADSFTDIDSADALTYSAMRANGTVLPSWLSFNAATLSFSGLVPDSAAGNMDIQVISSDRLGESASDVFKLTFAPRNQAPLTLADKARVAEDAMVTAAGNVLVNDSDLEGRTLRVTNPGSYVGTYGTMTLNSNGSYSYSLNNDSIAVQSLPGDPYTYRLGDWYYVASGTEWVLDHSGDQTVRFPRATDRFVYTVSDDDPRGALASQSEISVAVWGREDIPVAVADIGSAVEDGSAISGNVLANDYDVDAYATLDVLDNYTHTYTGNYGTLTMFGPADSLHARGEWSYSLNNASSAVQSLAAGQAVVDNFGYQIVDGSGSSFRSTDDPLWIPSSLSIVIAGLNDAPVLKAALADQTASANSSWSWVLPAGSFSDVDSGDVLAYRATLADSTALPSWLTFNAVTQSFIGTVPSTATGSVNIQVAATDRAGTSASDVFTLAFGKSAGGGGGGNGGGNGVGSKGNEGVGNGVDAPPPGQTVSFNDGLGTSPGNPGAKGGVTTKATGINELSGTTSALQTPSAPSVDLSTVPSYLGINDWAKYSTSPGAASVGGADAASVFARWLAMDLAVSSALANAAGGRLGVAAGGGDLSLLNQTGNGFLGSTTSFGKDTLSLLAVSGSSLNTFRGLGNGVQNIA